MKVKQTGGYIRKPAGQTAKRVCFACRKCFHSAIEHCVQCSGIVYDAGNFFRAPRKNNLRQWQILQKLVILVGYRFTKHGASGVMPDSLNETDKIISKKIRSMEPKLYKQKSKKDIHGQLKPQKFIYGE